MKKFMFYFFFSSSHVFAMDLDCSSDSYVYTYNNSSRVDRIVDNSFCYKHRIKKEFSELIYSYQCLVDSSLSSDSSEDSSAESIDNALCYNYRDVPELSYINEWSWTHRNGLTHFGTSPETIKKVKEIAQLLKNSGISFEALEGIFTDLRQKVCQEYTEGNSKSVTNEQN